MATRFLEEVDEMFQLNECEMTADQLAGNWPVYYHFYPSQETLRKLILRMVQIKNEETDLWQGFHPVERDNGRVTYHPDEMLEPYEV